MPSKPALRTELLFYLSFLAAAALLVGVATMLVVNVLAPQRTFVLLLLLVALEVGDPRGALGTYVEVLRRRGADAEVIAGVTRELERIDRIVRGLLDYARPHEEALAPLDPAAVARGAYGLLEAQGALRSAHSTLDLEPGIPHILGRTHLLEQAIVNLVLNAVDAAPGGTVVLG